MIPLGPDVFAEAVRRLVGDCPLHLAVSGGRDSIVLLDLAARAGIAAGVVHVDHGLATHSAAWARFCAAAAERRGLAFHSCRVGVVPGGDLEARARAARYDAFQRLLPGGAVVATAHHADDQAETVLLRLLRGSGVEGLTGIAPSRPLGPLTLIRPLLAWPREAIDTYARARGLEWVDDPDNAELTRDRNYLRHTVLPQLAARWPGVGARLGRLAGHARDARALAAWTAERLGLGAGPAPTAGLAGAPDPVAHAALRAWLRDVGMRPPPEARLRQGLQDLLAAAADREPVLAWDEGELRRHRDRLFRLPAPVPDGPAGRLDWEAAGHGLSPEIRESLRCGVAAPGERLRLVSGGPRRRVSELYRERGLAPWERHWWPVLRLDDVLVAVPGIGVATEYAVPAGWWPVWRPVLPTGTDVTAGWALMAGEGE
ncbi:tRNA(Ile)-lysidine synthase [wastewater metagenome]|uniref:tRNA(Ile)-lysidine synthetase n=4 Tax=root TaxID=1 RepID=A0A5B8R7K3_9ZZZZ|nr:tRNA lysidine(34) synthetase TilS [Arhodomonas aquaeolei]MCS4505645.1 tRNA lysidine(34) synthetase TilS [Arhodomonas aquaeolei]QEA04630.1 tRNA(Ile)-lysidine synthase [uncultured organism]